MSEGSDIDGETEVWLGGSTSVTGEQFKQALMAVEEMQGTLRKFRDEMDRMDMGLDRDDAVALIWGRTTLNKGQIEETFEVMDTIIEEDPSDIAPRLLSSKAGDLTIEEAATAWGEMTELAEKYGDMEDN